MSREEHWRYPEHRRHPVKIFFAGIAIGVILCLVIEFAVPRFFSGKTESAAETVSSVDGEHDVELSTKEYADFETPILGRAERESLLTVEERSVSVIVNTTENGLFDWEVFQKSQAVRYSGTAQYTIDLSDFSADDIEVDHETRTVTITIPDPELHSLSFDPAKTEVLSQSNGVLAWGDLELSAEETSELEASALEAMGDELDEENAIEDARRFARLSAWELFQPVVSSVSAESGEEYTLVIRQKESEGTNTDSNDEVH